MAMATVSLILTAASLATSAYSQWKAGKAEKKAGEAEQRAAESQAHLTEYNAAVAELQAHDALERGEIEANKFRTRTRGLVGEQRAGIAAGNIDVGYGSAVDVQADAAFLGELDALTITTNAAREAWGFRVQASDLEQQAEIIRKEGVNALAAGKQRQSAQRIGAIGTVLAGGASLMEARYGFGKK